jgi:GTP cyclohydrolase I
MTRGAGLRAPSQAPYLALSPHGDGAPATPAIGPTRTIDREGASRAVRDLLVALGEDVTEESLKDTPGRVAAAYEEMLTPSAFDLTTFPNDEGYDELVIARDIPFSSLCEHHLLPFHGMAHVAYSPGQRVLGLSKLARVVEMFSRRLQVQERLTSQVARWLQSELQPLGVGVVLEAEHMCMSLRGVRVSGSSTVTSTLLGSLREDSRTRAEFLSLVRR